MSDRNVIEEVEARLEYVPRWRLILGVLLLLPPFTLLGLILLTYELFKAGKRVREVENETLIAEGTASTEKSDGGAE
ncbi:hypothetical protein [Halegenticoccus tardaugens]|uniref:hypothetical protein n=1 Tax=Halegenticoccus tardaugens TaxID=2071624 RepID=UPI00100A71F7|nr:hypothetical protein [Halegenticoccus tardaugens]